MDVLSCQNKKTLKLDFNERSDSLPLWLSGFKLSVDSLWKYPNKGQLQEVICDKFQIDKEQLLITNGGDEAIELMFKWAKINDSKLILPLPVFSQYLTGKDSWKVNCKTIEPLADLNIDQESLLSSIEQNSIVVITSPNNPTGETLSAEQVRAICEKAKESNAYVFLDCAYIEFTNLEGEYLALLDDFDNLVMLRTLSKAYGLAAIRVGYLLGQQALINEFKKVAMPFNISQPNIELALLAFTQSASLEVKNYCKQINLNRQQIINYLSDYPLELNASEANFLLIRGDSKRLQLISAACKQLNIKIKTELVGLSEVNSFEAIRIAIPFYIKRLLSALKLALEPELICFDMDGVLIDTSESYDLAIIKTVEAFTGVRPTAVDVLNTRAQGGFNNDWILAQELIRIQGKEIEFNTVKDTFQSFYLGDGKEKGLYEQEASIIQRSLSDYIFIQKSKSLCTAIVTGRGKAEGQTGLNLLGILNTLLISDDDVIKSKPSPEGIDKAKKYYKKTSLWMLGDAPDDMLAAKSAGALAIGIGDDNLYKFGADIVLKSVNELEELL